MTEIILYGSFHIPAEQGPCRSKIYPPDQAGKIVEAFRERSNGGWLEYSHNPDKAMKRVAAIRRKARLRPNKRSGRHGPIQFVEGIRRRGGPRG